MKLEEPFELNEFISTASLPFPGEIHLGWAMLTGWGSISRTRRPEAPEALQAATLPILEYEECEEALTRRLKKEGRNPLHPTNICTGPLDGSQSACKVGSKKTCGNSMVLIILWFQGDSGGPLVKTNTFDMVEVIGVVSWGLFPCGGRNAPSVYTRVSAFVDWIHNTMMNE